MIIIEGELPPKKAWRELVLLAPGITLGLAWQLSLALAHANNGQLLTAVIIPDDDPKNLSAARAILEQVYQNSLPNNTVYPSNRCG